MSGPDRGARPEPSPAPASPPSPRPRRGSASRRSAETAVECSVVLDGEVRADVATGLPFLDHMLSQLGRHGGFDLYVRASGDIEVDAHHTVEDTGIVLGQALAAALGDKAGVRRFASISLPLDEALVEVALDLSGRAYLHYEVALPPDAAPLGTPGLEPQLAEELWRALVHAAGITLHVRSRSGRNTHHLLEACFKGVARCLRDAAAVEGAGVPSTKGIL